MKQFTSSFLRLSLLLAIGAMSGLQAASCDNACSDFSIASCNNSCNTSCDTSCGTSDCILSSSTCNSCCHSVYISRPTFNNTAYFWFPWRKDIDCEFNGIMELGFEYQRSFSSSHISRALFGSDRLHFQGSGIGNSITGAGRDSRALIADNFGLSALCDTCISFKPRIQNYNLNFHGRLGFDNWVEGLYGEVYFAFTHQNRNLHLETNVTCTTTCSTGCSTGCSIGCSDFSFGCSTGCSTNNSCNNSCVVTGTGLPGACGTPFVAGYMAPGVASTVGSLQSALTGGTFGDMQQPWSFGRFPFCSQTKNAVSGVALVAGWNFWQSDCGHFGLFFQYVAPTGNKPDPRYLFSPVVGNGGHNEVGGGLSAHYELWNNDCDQALNVYLDGYVMTALRNCQTRSFDFLGKGCLSRYMLLESLSATTPLTYTGSLINGIDFATRRAQVKVSVKGDATLRFVYSHGGFNFGFGYNAYGQSQEDVRLANAPVNGCNGTPVLTAANYGFKGCASLYAAGVRISPAVTQSGATINLCGVNDATPQFIQDPTVVAPAVSCSGNASDILSTGVLNLESGAAPKQFTNKGFATLDYTWAECNYSPYLGIGGEVEGGSRFSMNQFGVWIKGGIQF